MLIVAVCSIVGFSIILGLMMAVMTILFELLLQVLEALWVAKNGKF